jgi:import inner membrane translocase subunit TIM23
MSQHHEQKMEIFQDSDFGDKVSFTVGTSYGIGFFMGLIKGLKQGIPKTLRMPKKLIMNNFFNTVGKETSRFGNGFAAAGIMYYVIAGGMNLLFEDELEGVEHIYKNMMCGAATGMLFKSTLGVIPCIVGGLLGASLIGGLTLLTEEGNKRGLVAFEMKF